MCRSLWSATASAISCVAMCIDVYLTNNSSYSSCTIYRCLSSTFIACLTSSNIFSNYHYPTEICRKISLGRNISKLFYKNSTRLMLRSFENLNLYNISDLKVSNSLFASTLNVRPSAMSMLLILGN